MDGLGAIILLLLFYFLPTAVALRKEGGAGAIVLDVLFGWLAALIWAIKMPMKPEVRKRAKDWNLDLDRATGRKHQRTIQRSR